MTNYNRIRSFKDLYVWQESIELAAAVYRLTRDFPREELYGLTSQVRRASVSVPSNIAEGHGRFTTGEYLNQRSVASGSLCETESLCVTASRLGYGAKKHFDEVHDKISKTGKMLVGLRQSLS